MIIDARHSDPAGRPVLVPGDLGPASLVGHAFSTRQGGLAPGSDRDRGWRCFLEAADLPAAVPPFTLRQVHGARVHVADGRRPARPPTADAVITRRPGVVLAVQTADCAPVLLAHPGAGAVAAMHAGWRGLLAGVVEATVDRLADLGAAASGLRAVLGPCIGPCCFEVGTEVAARFAARDRSLVHPGPRRPHVDLPRAVDHALAAAGVPSDAVSWCGLCTCCRPDLFFSYRAEGPTGRLLAAVALRG